MVVNKKKRNNQIKHSSAGAIFSLSASDETKKLTNKKNRKNWENPHLPLLP